jgi:hypothetical protein
VGANSDACMCARTFHGLGRGSRRQGRVTPSRSLSSYAASSTISAPSIRPMTPTWPG